MLSVPAVPFRQPARVAFGRVRALLAWLLCAGALAAAAPAWARIPVLAEARSYEPPLAPGTPARSYAHDLTAALSRSTGLPLELQLGRFPAAIQQVEAGRADALGPMFRAPWLPATLIATESVGSATMRAYALTSGVRAMEQPLAAGRRVAVVEGLYPANWLKNIHPGVVRVPAGDFDDAVKLLVNGQADLLIGFEHLARRDIHQMLLESNLIEGPELSVVPQVLLVHARNPQLLRQLNEGIRMLRASGELDALRSKWEPAPVVTLREYRLRQWVTFGAGAGAVILLVTCAVALWLWRRTSRQAREYAELLGRMQWAEAMDAQTFDASPIPMAVSRASDRRIVRINDAHIQVFGYSRDEVAALKAGDAWANVAERNALIDQALSEGLAAPRDVQLRRADGKLIWARLAYRRFSAGGEDYLLCTAPEITELENQRREYAAMFHQAPLGMMVMVHEDVVQANAECERLMGWPAGTAVGRTALEFWRDVAERDWARSTYAQRLRTEGSIEFAREIGGYSGRRFFARGVAVRISDPADKHLRTLWICVDATEEARVAGAREAARRAAEDANDAKSRFLANVSHEIRTPLHALVNLHEMIGLTRLNDAQRELLHKASHAGHGLMALVSDVLDFSKIEAGALVLEHTPFALDALVQGVDSVLQAHPRAAGVHLSVQRACKGPVALVGDPTRLRQVLINLGTNALKFTPHGEVVVRIGCQPLADDAQRLRLVVSVRDTGIGMDAVTQAALFAPFLQADASITRRYGGTGLGLAISQSITRAMGGEITVQSSPGAGSEFMLSIELPMAPMESAALITGAAHGGVAGEAVQAAGEASGTGTGVARKAGLSGLRVLVVDDNELNRFVIKRLMGDEGARVGEAGDGRAALQWLATAPQPPDLVLMDLQMPVMDGLTALRAMRADARWRAIPVLVLTGDVTVEQQQAALAAGAAAFLSKPMTREQLLAQVVRLGITPRPVAGGATPDVASDGASDVTSGAASDAASDAATDAPQGTPPLASQAAAPELVPNLEQLDELLLSVAINELDWGRTQIAATAATDGARMAQVAHRIKGTARELRCEPLVAAALALEQAASVTRRPGRDRGRSSRCWRRWPKCRRCWRRGWMR